jgi:hypothetical protein
LYFAGGFAAMLTQTAMTLLIGTAAEAQVPELGASGIRPAQRSDAASVRFTLSSSRVG